MLHPGGGKLYLNKKIQNIYNFDSILSLHLKNVPFIKIQSIFLPTFFFHEYAFTQKYITL